MIFVIIGFGVCVVGLIFLGMCAFVRILSADTDPLPKRLAYIAIIMCCLVWAWYKLLSNHPFGG